MNKKNCLGCGAAIDQTYNVCPHCGTVQVENRDDTVMGTMGHVGTIGGDYGTYDPNPPVKSNGLPAWIYILISILGIMVLIAGTYFLFIRNNAAKVIDLTAPVYSVNEGSYSESQNVLISNNNDVNGADIYYTLDGTTPTENSLKYTNGQAVLIDKTSTLKSIVIDKNGNKSEVASVNYEIVPPETTIQVIGSGSNSGSTSNYSTPSSGSSSSGSSGSAASTGSSGSSYSSGGGYFFPDSASRVISESELYNLSEDECALARNEIYARHGRRFKTDWIQNYFNQQSWYNPIYSADEFDAMIDSGKSIFNSTELKNIDIIKSYEQRMGYL